MAQAMHTNFEDAYLEDRAETELALAQQAAHPAAVRAHFLLAGLYLDRLHGSGTVSASPARPDR